MSGVFVKVDQKISERGNPEYVFSARYDNEESRKLLDDLLYHLAGPLPRRGAFMEQGLTIEVKVPKDSQQT